MPVYLLTRRENSYFLFLPQDAKPEGEGNEYIKLKVVGQVSVGVGMPRCGLPGCVARVGGEGGRAGRREEAGQQGTC